MAQRFAKPWMRTSVNVSPAFYDQCKKYHIRFSEAMRVGISLLLAERGVLEYDNTLNISRKITLLNKKLSETSQELFDLKEKLNKTNA